VAEKDMFQRYLDAGIAFTNLTRARAEELVEDLIQGGELQGADAKARVEELLERSRRGRAAFVDQVRREVSHQMEALGLTSLEDLAHQVADLLSRTAETGKRATKKKAGKKKAAGKKAASKKSAAKKSRARKSVAKKVPDKKAAGKKAASKKAATKKSGATKSAAGAGGGTVSRARSGNAANRGTA
jgi:polyhydroxyalkanoate synthesis regulator phasin